MNKRSRFLLILVVLGVCFAFLWPSLSWYLWTPKEVQNLALGSLEKIKDYSNVQASADVLSLAFAIPIAIYMTKKIKNAEKELHTQ